MKKLLYFLLATAAAAAVLLYAVPQYLIRRDIAAAQPDLALLAPDPEPLSLKNGIDALWLLGYRTENDAERSRIMHEYGTEIMRQKQPQALSGRALPLPEAGQIKCPGEDVGECMKAVRADLPRYRADAGRYRALLDNVRHLYDYDTFAQRGWPNGDDDMSQIPLPPFQLLFYAETAAVADWYGGQHQAALDTVCRSIRTGRALLKGRPGLIPPMIGNALIHKNTALAAAMLAERPQEAARLPQSCDGIADVLTVQEQGICTAMRDEFASAGNLYRKLAHSPLQTAAAFLSPNGAAGNMTPDEKREMLPMLIPTFNAEHTQARSAAAFVRACTQDTAEHLKQDLPVKWPPFSAQDALRDKWACLGNRQGCLISDIATPDYSPYALRLQNTAMQQRALAAALALYRLPAAERRAAVGKVLAAHSSPSRKLSWDESARTITFPRHDDGKGASGSIPLGLE